MIINPSPAPRFFSPNELAQRWSVDVRTVNRWCREGTFPNAFRAGPGLKSLWRIPESDVLAYEHNNARRVAP